MSGQSPIKLILEMARDNPKWGCVRIRGELLKLGHGISASAIRKLLRRNRIGPAPMRARLSWKAFLRAQASAIVLTDFLSVDTVFLKRFYVLLYMQLPTTMLILFAFPAPPHLAVGLRTPTRRSDPVLTTGPLTCTERLGGLLREYAREQTARSSLNPG